MIEQDPAPPSEGHWAIGLGLAVAANLLNSGLIAVGAISDDYLLFPGVAQLVWVLPLTFFLLRKGHKRTVWGLLIAAGIVFLLNGACFGVFLVGLAGA
ncbi:MAG: hypothetical protein Q8P18_09035 [Pseudomonadota bacterium]|nr:hypothetical protein [Pseudomonadota bacterium]